MITETHVINRVNHWWAVYRKRFETLPVLPPAIDFSSKLITTAGMWSFSKNKLLFSYHFMSILSETEYDKTIAHEVAHAVADKIYGCRQKHNIRWRNIFALSGFTPDRCHNYQGTIRRRNSIVKFNCPHCQRQLTISSNLYTRMRNGSRRICLTCRKSFGYSDIMDCQWDSCCSRSI